MSDKLPVRHPSEYADTLEAPSRTKAVAVVESRGVLIAMGDDKSGEWIRYENEDAGTYRSSRHPDDTEVPDSTLSDPASFNDDTDTNN